MNYTVLALLIMMFPGSLAATTNVKTTLAPVKLKHKWQSECNATMCGYKSTVKPPAPFPGRNEAVMTVEVMPLKHKNLDALLKSEVLGVRKSLEVDEGAKEDDGKPTQKGVAVWKETLDGKEVGFIRYRAHASGPFFVTSIHGIILGTDEEAYVTLVTFYAGHQDETRADQMAILKALAKGMQ
jgi:hypothetical protein